MTDRSKFEQMLEHLINEDQDKAKELFHQLVVEKSREIYEGILAEEFGMYETEDEDEMAGEFGGEEGDIGGDETDDFIDDVDGEEGFGDEEGEEGSEDLEDRIVDLEDALDELRAEFEELMGQEEGEEEHADMFGSEEDGEESEDEGDFDFGSEEEGDDEELQDSFMREYVEQVGGKTYNAYSKGGDDGQNTTSVLAKQAKSPTGHGKPVNFSGESKTGGTQGGLAKPSAKEENFGNVNVPGGNAGKTGFKKKEAGHGAEKKGSGEAAANSKSIIGGKK
jgi:hypothetical protein